MNGIHIVLEYTVAHITNCLFYFTEILDYEN